MSDGYSISKSIDGWTISFDGATILLCEFEKTAIKTVRRANALSGDVSSDRASKSNLRRTSNAIDGDARLPH